MKNLILDDRPIPKTEFQQINVTFQRILDVIFMGNNVVMKIETMKLRIKKIITRIFSPCQRIDTEVSFILSAQNKILHICSR